MKVSKYLKLLPEIGFLFTLGVALFLSIYSNWISGSSLFQYSMIQEKGNAIQNLFAQGHVNQSQWWYGMGHTFYIIMIVPTLSYVIIRASMLLYRKLTTTTEPGELLNVANELSPKL